MRVCVNWKWIWLYHHYSFICGNINERFLSFLLYSAHHKLRPSNFIHYYYVTHSLTHSHKIPYMSTFWSRQFANGQRYRRDTDRYTNGSVNLLFTFFGCGVWWMHRCVRSVFNWSPTDRRTDFRQIWTRWSIRIALNVSNIFDWNIVYVDFSFRRPFSLGNLRPCV